MPKIKLSKRCTITNSNKAAKPHQLVIRAHNGHLVVTKAGVSVPWPKDVKLIIKGRGTAIAMMDHLTKLSQASSTKA